MSVENESFRQLLGTALKIYDFPMFTENMTKLSSDEMLDFFEESFAQPGSYSIRGGQKARNNFYLRLLGDDLFSQQFAKAQEYAKGQHAKILAIESEFDKIRATLPKCDISKYPVDIQMWSAVEGASQGLKHFHDKIDQAIQESMGGNAHYAMPEMLIVKNEEGGDVNIDGAFSSIISTLGLTLKMLAHQNGWIKGGKLIAPSRPTISADHVSKAAAIQQFALAWDALEDAANRTLFFGGEITSFEDGGVPEELFDKSFFATFEDRKVFYRSPCDIEKLDFLANRRLHSWAFQNMTRMFYSPHIDAVVMGAGETPPGLAIHRYISKDEAIVAASLSELFAFDIKDDQEKHHGLTLCEWVRGYSVLKLVVENEFSDTSFVQVDKGFLQASLRAYNLSEASASILINHLTFGPDGRDLFDSPLIVSEDGKYSFLPQALLSANLVVVIPSKLSTLDIELEKSEKGMPRSERDSSKKSKISAKKGKGFEGKVISFFNKLGYDCEAAKFNIDGAPFEYDALLVVDDALLLIECKNTSISGNNAVKALRYAQFLSETIGQIKRLEAGLKLKPDIVKSLFGRDLSEFRLIPLILNSFTYSSPPIDGVYISDFSLIGKFFQERNISEFSYVDGKKKVNKVLHQLWVGEKPTVEELLEYLAFPPQLKLIASHFTYHKYAHYTSEGSMFFAGVLDVDEDAMKLAKLEAPDVSNQ
ncbi:hypothetical protein PSE10A_55570 [Pseudomonas amygdali pv. eriobotryae]|uniref:NERD domain-containing protein n=1 Tax=Pseudomonas amygdali pv. eriobotryae TaxID=129137 RepID=A0A9P3AJN7_PSEA0|nr:hypothetical protein [Pseudomonas amygdali]GFZ63046.1 hypothetical protein PSE10A_55570 [Pseudomonas amygdali pv. eriobotryae]